mmetsp:Transcript_7744/g.15671  ORF Transcript_7744/g.15671 Transcript_7744/m.15671 type:complete len:215 (+) Transcript_7744:123-767(+)
MTPLEQSNPLSLATVLPKIHMPFVPEYNQYFPPICLHKGCPLACAPATKTYSPALRCCPFGDLTCNLAGLCNTVEITIDGSLTSSSPSSRDQVGPILLGMLPLCGTSHSITLAASPRAPPADSLPAIRHLPSLVEEIRKASFRCFQTLCPWRFSPGMSLYSPAHFCCPLGDVTYKVGGLTLTEIAASSRNVSPSSRSQLPTSLSGMVPPCALLQ